VICKGMREGEEILSEIREVLVDIRDILKKDIKRKEANNA